MFCFLVVVVWSLCNNSLNCMFMICILLHEYFIKNKRLEMTERVMEEKAPNEAEAKTKQNKTKKEAAEP